MDKGERATAFMKNCQSRIETKHIPLPVGKNAYRNSAVAVKDSCSVIEKTRRNPSPLRK